MREYRNSNFSRTIMGLMAAQDPALTVLVMVVAVLIPVSRAKATNVVLINSLVKGISSSSLVIRVTQSS